MYNVTNPNTGTVRRYPISKSIEKKEFLEHKNEFYDALIMQRKYWEKRGFEYKSDTFFGYKLS